MDREDSMAEKPLLSGLLASAFLAAPACAVAQTPEDVGAKAKPIACDQLTTEALGLANATIISAMEVAADKGLPTACVITGAANQRTGADGKSYALDFEMRLPLKWNGRFLHQVNGGVDGAVLPAIGDLQELNAYGGTPALARGFAVLSSDEGHNGDDPVNAAFGLASGTAFAVDPQARADYGYAGDMTLGPIGKAIIAKFYGEPPARSYMFGCSNGGRHAMVAASRMGDQYDGFVAGDPGFNLPRAAVQHAWDIQSFEMVDPDVKKSFSPADMALISRKVLEVCDKLDGVEDGMVGDIRACQKVFHLSDLQCAADKTDQCLSKAQVEALTRAFGGPRNSKGEQLYSDWSFDAGMSSSNWRFWKVFSGIPPWNNNPLIATMGAAALEGIFTTPPSFTKGDPDSLMAFLSRYDFDRDAPKIYAKGAYTVDGKPIDYPESAWEFMTPPDADNPKLEALKAAGHKIILYHGQSDGVFSFNASAAWIEKLNANNGGDAGAFARLFAVPGMNHCAKGPTTDRFDMLSAIVDWVEHNKAPDRVIASVSSDNTEVPADWSRDRTRPLCPWPKVARYVGGDKEKAESFECR
jgi:pimeloyl-ACP methyl ester carboxylesterase